MPKKFKGENSKAAEARARKSAAKNEAEARRQAQLEDEYWKDDDKHVAKKQLRKENKEHKRNEQLERKKELQKMHDEELASLKSGKPAAAPKVTRHELELAREKRVAEAAAAQQQDVQSVDDEPPLVENLNRLQVDGVEARTVDEAISALSSKPPEGNIDRHPEKRMKAAYTAFEEVNLPRLKAENTNLRLSQIKQMLRKEWMKSPENPLNQRLLAINSAK